MAAADPVARKAVTPRAGTVIPSGLLALISSLVRILANLTLYVAPCLSGGAVTAALHTILGLDLPTAFILGFFALVGPIYLAYASGWGMRRTLVQIQEWEKAGLIDAAEAQQLRRRALDWYIARRFSGRRRITPNPPKTMMSPGTTLDTGP